MINEDLARKYRDLMLRYVELRMENEKLKHQLELLASLGVSIKTEREDSTNAAD